MKVDRTELVGSSPSSGDPIDFLSLKWGTLKGWDLKSEAARAAARKYGETGQHSMGAMSQRDTPEQKAALCDLIDAINGRIVNDWSGEEMSKEAAKAYVLEYGLSGATSGNSGKTT